MNKYKILFKGRGITSYNNKIIRRVSEYESWDDIPTFDLNKTPISEGLKLLEKSDKLSIVNAEKEIPDLEYKKVEEEIDEDENEDKVDETKDKEPEESKEPEISTKVAKDVEEEVKKEMEENGIKETGSEEGEDKEDEKDEAEEDETPTITFDGEEIELTYDALDELNVSVLDDICKENDLTGYSALVKKKKIDFIIENLS